MASKPDHRSNGAEHDPAAQALTSQPLEQVLGRMSAMEPGPAAGSAAAITAAIAAALLTKTARLSRQQLPGAQDLARTAEHLRERALELAQADADAVQALLTGGSGPADPSAIPQRIGDLARELADLATRICADGKESLRADAAAAGHLARAAEETVGAIVASNAETSP